jgi:hypothetical protein
MNITTFDPDPTSSIVAITFSQYEHGHERATKIVFEHGCHSVAFSPQANYTDRATAACWRS